MFYLKASCILALMVLLGSSALHAGSHQLYLYGTNDDLEELPQKPSARFLHLEIQASAVASLGNIKDKGGRIVSRQMNGYRGTGFLHLGRWLALGGQIEKLNDKDRRTDIIKPIKREMWSVLLKWTLTPETEPKFYAVLGAGQAQYQSGLYLRNRRLDAKSPVLVGGLGIDIRIWKGLRLLGEYQLHYDTKKWQEFMMNGPHERHEFSAALAYLF